VGHVGMVVIGDCVGHVGMALIGAIGNSLRKLAAVALSSPQIPHGISR